MNLAAGARAFADARALIPSDDVHAVVVASRDATHAEYVLATMEAGKPVLCQKPIAATAADALRILNAEAATRLSQNPRLNALHSVRMRG